jgi:hypothetical protein
MDLKLNGHYDTWCYLPVVGTAAFNDEPAQFAVAAVLRPGKAPAGWAPRGVLRALLRRLRRLAERHVPRAPGRRLRQSQGFTFWSASRLVVRGHAEQPAPEETRAAAGRLGASPRPTMRSPPGG